MELSNVYPYLVPGLFNPDWELIAVPVGHGVYATLFVDDESAGGIVHMTVSPEMLAEAGITAAVAHAAALDNLTRFANNQTGWGLSMQMIGRPGEAVNFLLICDHPRAAACLRLKKLHEHASRILETPDLCACVPQRELLVVLPRRDRAYREMVVGRLRVIEGNARRPISFALFDLSAEGVREFVEPE